MKFFCPVCKTELKLDDQYYYCPNETCSNHYTLYEKEKLELQPNYHVDLKKNKVYGKVSLFINTKKGMLLFKTSKKGNFFIKDRSSYYWGPFTPEDIIEFSVAANDTVVYQTSKGFVPMLLGGALFGGAGALAGSFISDKKQSVKNIKTYTITFKIKSFEFPGVSVEFLEKEKDIVFNLVSTIELLRNDNQ